MIVKIQDGKGWVIYDNFDEVQYKHLRYREAMHLDSNGSWFADAKNDNTICVHIHARKKQPNEDKLGWECNIVASGMVFLCNDEGKTIERIN